MPEKMLYWSLKNLYAILQCSEECYDTFQLVTDIAKYPLKGGVYKIGPLSGYDILSFYSMMAVNGNHYHAQNAIILKNDHASEFLQTKYGFKPSQQKQLLSMAKQMLPLIPLHVVENVSCKMSYDASGRKSTRCDTMFSDQ
eukprot:12465089-Ditylum_brightwellii.AAC.1